MSKESGPDKQPTQRSKAILCFIGSGVLALTTVGLTKEALNGNWAAMELTTSSLMGGIGLGYYGVEILRNRRKPDDGSDDGWNGGGDWEPEPDAPMPIGGGPELTPDIFVPDNICHPSLWLPANEPEHQPV